MCRAISATIRLESRPPLSIAPSGTSLISRSRTDSSSLSRTISRPLLGAVARVGIGRRVAPPALEARLAIRHDEPFARLELAHVAQRRHRPRNVTEHQVGRDRLGVELVADEAARQHALELRAEHDDVAGERVVERLDARAGRGSVPRAARRGPRRRRRTSRAVAPPGRARAPRTGGGGPRCRSGCAERGHGRGARCAAPRGCRSLRSGRPRRDRARRRTAGGRPRRPRSRAASHRASSRLRPRIRRRQGRGTP